MKNRDKIIIMIIQNTFGKKFTVVIIFTGFQHDYLQPPPYIPPIEFGREAEDGDLILVECLYIFIYL